MFFPNFAHIVYRIYPRYSGREAWVNCVEPDQTPHNAAADLSLLSSSIITDKDQS